MRIVNYVMCHKDFIWNTELPGNLTVAIGQKPVKTNLPLIVYESEYDDRSYGELPVWQFIYDNMRDTDLAVLHHYRRAQMIHRLSPSVAMPFIFKGGIGKQMEAYHSPICCDMLKSVDANLEQELFYPYNMFAGTKKFIGMWLDYCKPKIDYICDKWNLHSHADWKAFVNKEPSFFANPSNINKQCNETYQSRVPACMLERISSNFFYQFKMPANKVVLLEEGQTI